MIIAKDANNLVKLLLIDANGYLQVVNSGELPAGTQEIGKVQITDGVEDATVSTDGYLDVKTHTPDKCFASNYALAATNEVIITPTAGKRIRIVSCYVSTNTVNIDITLAFGTSGNVFFKLYTAQKAAQTGNTICATGAVNETIKLTSGASTFVSIGYDEV